MLQLIYVSAETVKFSKKALEELLQVAKRNNDSLGVSGMLLYQDGAFLQVLEGEAEATQALFEKIQQDQRHDCVRLLLRREIDDRSFAEWKMGFYDASGQELEKFPGGFSDFLQQDEPLDPDDVDRAHQVLMQFKEGSWRQKVS